MSAPTQDRPTTPAGDRSPFASKGFIFGTAVVVIVLVMLAWLLLTPADPEPRQQPGQAQTTTPVVEPTTPSACGLPSGDQTPPVVTPDSEWQLVGLMAAPTGPDAGPGVTTSSGLPACYAPTPLGALYSVANFIAASTDPGQRIAAATELTAPGEGRDALLAELQRELGGRSSGVRVAGFSFISYDPARSAVIDLAITDGEVLAHVALSTVWTGGDWKLQVPVTGGVLDQVQALPSLSGYVAWSGQ